VDLQVCCDLLLTLVQVLQGVDASLVFADGSTLLHEAVDLAMGDAHVQVLLDAVLGSMGPADLMAQNPADRQFLNHMHEGKTALFRVGGVLQHTVGCGIMWAQEEHCKARAGCCECSCVQRVACAVSVNPCPCSCHDQMIAACAIVLQMLYWCWLGGFLALPVR
jgi:hypothetical protein